MTDEQLPVVDEQSNGCIFLIKISTKTKRIQTIANIPDPLLPNPTLVNHWYCQWSAILYILLGCYGCPVYICPLFYDPEWWLALWEELLFYSVAIIIAICTKTSHYLLSTGQASPLSLTELPGSHCSQLTAPKSSQHTLLLTPGKQLLLRNIGHGVWWVGCACIMHNAYHWVGYPFLVT